MRGRRVYRRSKFGVKHHPADPQIEAQLIAQGYKKRAAHHVALCLANPARARGDLLFDSEAEARRYDELVILQDAGKITSLETQPKFLLHAQGGGLVGKYVGDFSYMVPGEGSITTEDLKSKVTVRLPLYVWKRRHMLIQYGIKIVEVMAD